LLPPQEKANAPAMTTLVTVDARLGRMEISLSPRAVDGAAICATASDDPRAFVA
jgi:hypothetical protein